MGAYLSHPVTDKISSDEFNDRLKCGVSSMQGWRVCQEDAHNSILNFSENVSLFAVYDGHGGKEVAEYTAQKLPSFISETESFKNGKYAEALKEAFLQFDKSLTEPDVISILKEIAKDKEAGDATTDDEEDENLGDLKEEAEMPLEEVIAKYATGKAHDPKVAKWKSDVVTPVSPFLRAKCSKSDEAECTSSCTNDFSIKESSDAADVVPSCSSSTNLEPAVSSTSKEKTRTSLAEKYWNGEGKDVTPDSSVDIGEKEIILKEDEVVVNGNCVDDEKQDAEISSSENGPVGKSKDKGKGKAILKSVPSPSKKKSVSPDELFKKFVASAPGDDSSESDSDDGNFMGQEVGSSSDEEVPGVQSSDGAGCSSAVDNEGEDAEGEEDCEEEAEEEEEEDDVDDDFRMNLGDEPGSDSGCTAVVALVLKDKVYVANAGDSRCIASRSGEAVELSLDHKPEDEAEMQRIVKAGGKVTAEGRVNGGLNLSRALGDHIYKQVQELPAEEQMISPMPDIKELDITSDVEFLVLACDGIWNYMTSQEVVDFVRPRLQKNPENISKICEELFDTCLAPHTGGDGTGCDNMTAIIVQFRDANLIDTVGAPKRKLEEAPNSEAEIKRSKTESDPESTTDTPSCSDLPETAP